MKGEYKEIKAIAGEIYNADVPLPSGADVFKKLKLQTSEVVRASLRTWQNAYEYAKDVDNPDRTELLEIYETIEIDTHVSAVIDTIYQGVSSMDFVVKNANNEPDEEKTSLFKTQWFNDWLAIQVEAILWGFSGTQYGEVVDDKFKSVKSIPRYNIRPEQNGIASNQNRTKADLFFDKAPYKNWTTLFYPRMFGDQYQLGKYNKIAKLFILKREVVQFWAIFNELFGHPYRVTKTAIKDKVRRQNAITAMESMTATAWTVVDLEDEIEFISPTSGTGYSTFQDFAMFADKQISKCLIGSTMVLDEGSSRSQGEVHKQNTSSFIESYSEMIQSLINDELIPKMVALGFPISKDDTFVYESVELISKSEWVEMIVKLSTQYDIDTEFIKEHTGIPVEEKIIELPVAKDGELNNSKNSNRLMNFYKKYFK